jgi:colanic acid biosynthesis glycosyl transferase WcaI
MRFWIVSAVFPPEPLVSSRTSADIAEELARRGHKVTVIAPFPNRPAGEIYPGYSRRLIHCEERDGYQMIRCFSVLSKESRTISRFLENLSFGLTSGLVTLFLKRPDVIYANTWPIAATGILYTVSKIRNIPLVVSVQDIYPESLVAQGRIKANGWAAKFMRWMDGVIARSSQSIITISKRFRDLYMHQRNVPSKQVHLVRNWMGGQSVSPVVDAASQRAALHIPKDAFVAVYGGNIGSAAGVETLIEAMGYFEKREDLYLVIAGAGSNLKACRDLAERTSSNHIQFKSPWPAVETSEILGMADVLLLPTHGSQSLVSVPSKLIAYMLAEKPVIALALSDSDLAQFIDSSGCGWVISPDQPKLLATKIKDVMFLDLNKRVERGQKGREFALRHLTREACLPRIIQILEDVADEENG